jgi:hypothetical protein
MPTKHFYYDKYSWLILPLEIIKRLDSGNVVCLLDFEGEEILPSSLIRSTRKGAAKDATEHLSRVIAKKEEELKEAKEALKEYICLIRR